MDMELSDALSWDEVAEAYKENFGGTPRIRPMEDVFDRVASIKDKFYVDPDEGSIHKILKSEENKPSINWDINV